MRNEPEENVLLSSVVLKLCSFPVKLDTLDGQFNSTTSPYDKTHGNLAMLQMIMFDQPLSQEVDCFSLLSSLKATNTRVEDYMQDDNFSLLVKIAKQDGDLRELSIPSLTNAWLQTSFKLNRVQIFNCLIFRELMKSIMQSLCAKELFCDMIESYEEACAEDIALEASLTVFSKKKMLKFVDDKLAKS